MPIRAEGFDKDIEALIDEAETEVRKVAFAWLQALMLGTPVNFGFHRNNWHLDFNSANLRVEGSPGPPREKPLESLPALDGTSTGRLRAAAAFLESWNITTGSIFIHNSGPAILILDSGEGSKQAPQGILDPATAAVRAEFGLVS